MTTHHKLIHLTVVSGPDLGLQRTFEEERISIGRAESNTFPLSDGFVSSHHGIISLGGAAEQVEYRDLQSRHGSLLSIQNVSYHLHNKHQETTIKIDHGTEIQLGCTLIRVTLRERHDLLGRSRTHTPKLEDEPPSGSRPMRETLITTSHQPVQDLGEQLETGDERLAVIFRLAGVLNGLTRLDEIMDHILDTVFEAFPAASFFSMILLEEEGSDIREAEPFISRHRRVHEAIHMGGEESLGMEGSFAEPIISKSILERVVKTKESVLFVKDSLGSELSQSIIEARITACLCAPLVGQRSLLGVMELDTRGQGSLFSKKDLELFNMVASLAAFALERARLSKNIVEMFESFVSASVNAIEARDPTTAGHSERVALYTLELAQVTDGIKVGYAGGIHFTQDELTELRYAALLHDFGKIAVREDVLQKARRLPELHIELIAQRFETIKALAYKEHLEGPILASVTTGKTLGRHELESLQSKHAAFCAQVDETLRWLDEMAGTGYMDPEACARVREIGTKVYVDAHGHKVAYLTPFEVENLAIQKGTLNEEEWDNMRSHARFSQDYLERIPWSAELKGVPCIAGAHHEKLDGSGYPLGLKEMHILPQVRMLTIADIFDALTASDRPYRKAATVERACKILNLEADDRKLDKGLVAVFEDLVVPRILHHIPSLQR